VDGCRRLRRPRQPVRHRLRRHQLGQHRLVDGTSGKAGPGGPVRPGRLLPSPSHGPRPTPSISGSQFRVESRQQRLVCLLLGVRQDEPQNTAPLTCAAASNRSISLTRPRYRGMTTSRPPRRWVPAILSAAGRTIPVARFLAGRLGPHFAWTARAAPVSNGPGSLAGAGHQARCSLREVMACGWTTAVRLWTRPSPKRLGAACSGTRG